MTPRRIINTRMRTGTLHHWYIMRRVVHCEHSTAVTIDAAGDRAQAASELRAARRSIALACARQRQDIRDAEEAWGRK